MKKITKVVLLLSILLFTSITFCYNYSFADNATNDTAQITTTVSSTTSSEDSLLTNIINILLISVGVVIILLAIAILTKLKK